MRSDRGSRRGSPYLAGAPLLIAHRGGAGLAPENTRTAFQRAVRWWRSDILELDVQPTREGEAVVFHDPTLERTTDGEGPVSARSLAELRELDAGHHFLDPDGGGHTFRGTGVGISTFREILEAFPTTRINVEIKDARAQESVRASIEEAGAWNRVLVAAGRRANRSRFAEFRGPVSASGEELRAFYAAFRLRGLRLLRLSCDALQMPERYGGMRVLTPRLVRAAHERNLPIHVWTVDGVSDMRRLLEWGVDGIVTDRPDRLARLLYELRGRPLPPGPGAGES